MKGTGRALGRYAFCLAGVGALIFAGYRLLSLNATTVALLMLLLVLAAATRFGLSEAIFTAMISGLGFNFYFLPPVGTFTVSDPGNWVALFAFLITAVTVGQLSAMAKRRTAEAVAGRDEIGKLYELSRAMLMDEARDAVRAAVIKTGQILNLRQIAFFDAADGQVYGTLANSGISSSDLRQAAATGEPVSSAFETRVIPVRMGTHVVGSLAMQGVKLSSTVEDSVVSLFAINYERVRALDRAGAAEVARRNEEFRSALLDGLAHDLKTPLTAIRTCVTRLITIPPRTEDVRQELLAIIDQESARLQCSIGEAIQLARIESRELHLSRDNVSAADLIASAVAESRDEDQARYSVEIEPENLILNVDCDLLRRALLQILENANKYAPPGTPIQIAARSDGRQSVISVSDTGPGIGQDELERIFDKFYRGRRAGTRRDGAVEGTGMGLAIAKAIIEAHGGKIHAENRAGGGTCVSFTLPMNL